MKYDQRLKADVELELRWFERRPVCLRQKNQRVTEKEVSMKRGCILAIAFGSVLAWSMPTLANEYQLQEMGFYPYLVMGETTTSVVQQGSGLFFDAAEAGSVDYSVSKYDVFNWMTSSTASGVLYWDLDFRLIGPEGGSATVNGNILMDLTYLLEADADYVATPNAVATSYTQPFYAGICTMYQCTPVASWSGTLDYGVISLLGFPGFDSGNLTASDSFSFGTVAVNNLPEANYADYFGEYLSVWGWYETDATANANPYGHAFALATGDEQINLTIAPQPTPEPGRLSLIGLGLIGFAALFRKKLCSPV